VGFAADPERVLRVYTTADIVPDSATLSRLQSSLSNVFKDVSPSGTIDLAQQWERGDGRATLAWFSSKYMKFVGVERMPSNEDAHHTIPRIVVSHAIGQSRFLAM